MVGAGPTDPNRSLRILIVRLSAIGDVIHALPCLRLLRQALPDATLGWVVEDFASAFVVGNPDLNHVHVIPKSRWRGAFFRRLWPEMRPFAREIRRQRYDVAIDFQGLTKSGVWAWLSGARRRIGFGDEQGAEINKWFTNERVVPPREALHVVERNAALLRPLGIDAAPEPAVIPLTEADALRAAELWAAAGLAPGERVAGLNVGAGWETKRWPVEHWTSLALLARERLGLKPLLLWGSPDEKRAAEDTARRLGERGEPAALAPPTTVRESAALVRLLALYCGGDTGTTHIAASLGIPTVGLYGASDSVRNAPFGLRATALKAADVSCAPCWKKRCRYSRWIACLQDLTPERVVEAAEKLLERGPAL